MKVKLVHFADDAGEVKPKSVLKPAPLASVATGMPVKHDDYGECKESSDSDWGIDSMSSIHASGNRRLFTNIRIGKPIEVTVANKSGGENTRDRRCESECTMCE